MIHQTKTDAAACKWRYGRWDSRVPDPQARSYKLSRSAGGHAVPEPCDTRKAVPDTLCSRRLMMMMWMMLTTNVQNAFYHFYFNLCRTANYCFSNCNYSDEWIPKRYLNPPPRYYYFRFLITNGRRNEILLPASILIFSLSSPCHSVSPACQITSEPNHQQRSYDVIAIFKMAAVSHVGFTLK